MGARAGMSWRPRAACTSIVSVDMDDEDGRCLLDVICDPQALNDFLHGSETHLDTDDLLDGSADAAASFFSSSGVHVPEVQPSNQLLVSEPPGLPSGSVDLDFLEDDDILGASPGGSRDGGRSGVANHEPCDILQQSLAEANITEQSLQEAEAELDLGPFGLPGLTQVVQTLPDPSLSLPGTSGTPVRVDIGGQIFPGSTQSATATPTNAAPDVLGSVLAHPGLQLQPQVMNKAVSVQPFMQQVGLGNVTLQPISGLQALPNGSQSGHLGIGQIQVVGQPTVMAINPSGQPILAAKSMSGYQLHQPGPDTGSAGSQGGIGGSVLSSAGGMLIQSGKATLGSPALNGVGVNVSSASASGVSTIASSGGLVGFGTSSLGVGVGVGPQQQAPTPGQVMQNVIIQRTPTPIQPKPPQGGTIQPKLYKQQHVQQQQQPSQQQLPSAPNSLQNDASKGVGVPQGPVPVSTTQSVAFLTGKPGANVVLSAQPSPQGATAFPQTLFKQQAPHTAGKPLSVHLLNQSGSIVIPSQTVLQGQNHQFLLPQLQTTGGQILTQGPGGHHIITSQGPGGQIIANQILAATNQNLNLGQVLTSQGTPGTAHILSGHIQLQPGQMGQPTLFQMPVSLAQTQTQSHAAAGHPQAVIQGMPLQNSVAMLGQVEGLGPAVSLQPQPLPSASTLPPPAPPLPLPQQQSCIIPGSGGATMSQCQPTESAAVLGGSADQAQPPQAPPSILTIQTASSTCVPVSVPSSLSLSSSVSPSSSSSSSIPPSSSSSVSTGGLVPSVTQHSPGGKLFIAPQASGMILSQESLQMFLQQIPPTGHQQQLKIQSASPSQPLTSDPPSESPQSAQPSPLVLGQQIHSPHPTQIQTQTQTPSRSCTPSSMPPLFIIQNQIGGSPQPVPQTQQPQQQPQQPQIQVQQPHPPSQPTPFQQEASVASAITPSCSPKPPLGPTVQFQLAPAGGTVVQGLTTEQQQTLQLVGAQLQTLSSIAQPSQQQKQLLEKLQQIQQSIILQAKQQTMPQPPVSNQFGSPAELPTAQAVTSSASASSPAQLASLLQQTSVLVKTPSTVSSEVKVYPGALGTTGAMGKSGLTPASLTQSVQAKQGVISSVGGLAVRTGGGLQIQVLGSGISQLTTHQSAAGVQVQTTALKRPFSMEPSKEARMLEQLRKQQGSVLRPDYSSPFRSFEDGIQRLLPYHLYQGTVSTPQDFTRVDEEFQNVSGQLLKRTQAMLDKYRLLLFEESKRLGPSAEMVMIDRMFIQEEKIALNQDRVLAKERPEEYVAHSFSLESTEASAQRPLAAEPSTVKAGSSVTRGVSSGPAQTSVTPHFTPTKLVIKQGGRGASVSWSTSPAPSSLLGGTARLAVEPAGQSSSSASLGCTPQDYDDALPLPQRSSKPPMKTYEARRRIGLKLKIKQEAGLSKVVHNTALDPVHTQTQPQQPGKMVPLATTAIRTPSHPSTTTSTMAAIAMTPTPPGPASTATTALSSSSSSSSLSSSSSSSLSLSLSSSSSSSSAVQVNGSLEHHHNTKQNPIATAAPTTCRLPLRKTYRENISPQLRPGVPGGGSETGQNASSSAPPQFPPSPCQSRDSAPSPSPPPHPERTAVIASVKLEKRGGSGMKGRGQLTMGTEHEPGVRVSNVAEPGRGSSPPRLMKDLAEEVEEAFYREMIKNTRHRHRHQRRSSREGGIERQGNEREGVARAERGTERGGGDGSSQRDRQTPSLGPPSPAEVSHAQWDPSLMNAKRRKSDSPRPEDADLDNASFSSGSPPPDHSLNEHLQSAIDSILNLQQGTPNRTGAAARIQGAQPPHQPSSASSTLSNRLSTSSSSSSSHLGGAGGRGHNGNFVSRTYSR